MHGVKAAPCGAMKNRNVGNDEAAGDRDQSLPGLRVPSMYLYHKEYYGLIESL